MKKIGVARFPGTNCDRDVFDWVTAKGYEAQFLWHLDKFEIHEHEMIILPGGFSYGDYLRSGALAALSPIMQSIKDFAAKGKPILGICNGFQILCETGLLPGVLVQNQGLKFIDKWVELEVIRPVLQQSSERKNIAMPIAHGDGRYFADKHTLDEIQENDQVWLKYKSNPNGSFNDIAGVMNKNRNVFGLMPHPERALYDWMGGEDGWELL